MQILQQPHTGHRLRVGVLGNGFWACSCHGAALQADPDVEFVGFWGRNPVRTAGAVQRVGGRAFDRMDDLLGRVDAVSIALPPQAQAPAAVHAARAGVHLLLDKPLALDLAAADDVVLAARAAGVRTMSFMTFLFQPVVVDWLTRLRSLAALHGPWESLTISLAGNIDAPGSPYASSEWRRQHGGLWDWGPHALSLVQEIQGPVAQVSATRGMRDVVNVALEHTDGATSLLTLTVTAPSAAQHLTASVWGPGGRHKLEIPADNLREAYLRALKQFRDCIETGVEHPLNAQYGRETVAILDAAQRNPRRERLSRMDLPARATDPSRQ